MIVWVILSKKKKENKSNIVTLDMAIIGLLLVVVNDENKSLNNLMRTI